MTLPIGQTPLYSHNFPTHVSSQDAKTQAVSKSIFMKIKERFHLAIQFMGSKIHIFFFHTLKLESLTLRMSTAWHTLSGERDALKIQNQQLLQELAGIKSANSDAYITNQQLHHQNRHYQRQLQGQTPEPNQIAPLKTLIAAQIAQISELQAAVHALQEKLSASSAQTDATLLSQPEPLRAQNKELLETEGRYKAKIRELAKALVEKKAECLALTKQLNGLEGVANENGHLKQTTLFQAEKITVLEARVESLQGIISARTQESAATCEQLGRELQEALAEAEKDD